MLSYYPSPDKNKGIQAYNDNPNKEEKFLKLYDNNWEPYKFNSFLHKGIPNGNKLVH